MKIFENDLKTAHNMPIHPTPKNGVVGFMKLRVVAISSGGCMKGKCLCGSIEVVADDQKEVGLCHCSMCRRWSGGPMFAVHCGAGVKISGNKVLVYRSSDWAERGFCSTCGTHLFHHLLSSDEYILPAGIFQDQDFQLTNEIFIDEKPAFYELKNETDKLTGQQVFEQFAPK